MDPDEVREFLKTDEGKQLAEEIKAPLLAKRDELLTENKRLGEQLTSQTQRADDSEKLLTDERSALHSHVVDTELDRLMDEHGVLSRARESLRSAIKSQNEIKLETADGGARVPKVANGETEVTLSEYMQNWSQSEEAKSFLPASGYVVGGPSRASSGSGENSSTGSYSAELRSSMGLNKD